MSSRESIHPVAWPSVIQLALRPDRLPRFIQTPVDAAYGCSVFSSSPELTSVWRTDSSSRSIQTQVDAVNGRSVFLSPSGLTFAPGPARPAAMPTFVARPKVLRFRPRRRAFDSRCGDRVWIVTTTITGAGPMTPPHSATSPPPPVHRMVTCRLRLRSPRSSSPNAA